MRQLSPLSTDPLPSAPARLRSVKDAASFARVATRAVNGKFGLLTTPENGAARIRASYGFPENTAWPLEIPLSADGERIQSQLILEALHSGSVISHPIFAHRRERIPSSPIGWISIFDRDVREWNSDEDECLRDLTDIASSLFEFSFERNRDLLQRASTLLQSSLDFKKTLETIGCLIVPEFADWSFLTVLHSNGPRFYACNRDPRATANLNQIYTDHPIAKLPEKSCHWQAIVAGQELLFPEMTEEIIRDFTWNEALVRPALEAGLKSSIVIPLRARGNFFGALAICTTRESGRALSADSLELARELAARASIALDNARLYEDAQNAAKDRQELLAVVSHELKNPLAAIMMGAGWLRRSYGRISPEAAIRQLETVSISAHRMERLIRDLLDLAKMQAGHLHLTPRKTCSTGLIREAIGFLDSAIQEKGLNVSVRAPDPGIPVICDHDRVIQVLINLITNSVKFTPKGGHVAISVETLETDEVRFGISDNGPGIHADQLPYIFDRFWQATSTASLGSGLGLTISKAIIDAHRGKIWAQSSPGQGATFYFSLPAQGIAPEQT